ncbi:Gfo/Idh/MocA family protein [Herbiconiux sp. UC225_62]|uniref:Gfo/Idh/MocA family protein n=1 Tax=Herbiconiux sp. UC225_62 TaxID=3350168 RepID=UPI0036D383EA
MTRLFLVGAGYIAREHAAAAFDPQVVPDGVELHVTDSNSAVLDDFVARFPGVVAHPDVDALFAAAGDPDDIAIIATPPVTHAALVMAALGGGLHVLCEKPLMMSSVEAHEAAALAERTGRILESCDIRFTGLAATHEVKRLVDDGELGAVYHVTFANTARRARSGYDHLAQSGWFRDPSISGGGVMMDWGPYDIAVLDAVLQPVRVEILHAWASAPRTGGPFEAESTLLDQHVGASMIVERRDGLRVPVSYERAAATHGDERSAVQIEGSLGAVSWDWLDWSGDGTGAVRLTRDIDGRPDSAVTRHAPPATGFHARPLARMVRAVREGEDPTAVTDGAVFRFDWVRAILDSAASGQPVVLTRDDTIVARAS